MPLNRRKLLMKHWFRNLILGCTLVSSAAIFTACDVNIQASIPDIPQKESVDQNHDDNRSMSEPEEPTNPTVPTEPVTSTEPDPINEPVAHDETEDEPKVVVPPHEHEYGNWIITTAATCTKEGRQEKRCSCGDAIEATIPTTEHHYELKEKQDPTCTETGSETYICPDCLSSYTKALAKIKHNYVNETVEATCTEDGYAREYCTICSHETQRTDYPARGHNFTKIINSHTKQCEHCDILQYSNPIEDIVGSYWLEENEGWAIYIKSPDNFSTYRITSDSNEDKLYKTTPYILSGDLLFICDNLLCFENKNKEGMIYNYNDFTLTYKNSTDNQGNISYQLSGQIANQNKTLTFIGYDL